MMARKLDVYLREVKIGVLGQDTNANLSFTYNEDYRQLKNAQAISVSMPWFERSSFSSNSRFWA